MAQRPPVAISNVLSVEDEGKRDMADEVVIRFKESEPVEIEIDMSRLTWRDVFVLQKAAPEDGVDSEAEVLEIVQKCIPDHDVMTLPATTMEPIMQAIFGRLRKVEEEQKN